MTTPVDWGALSKEERQDLYDIRNATELVLSKILMDFENATNLKINDISMYRESEWIDVEENGEIRPGDSKNIHVSVSVPMRIYPE